MEGEILRVTGCVTLTFVIDSTTFSHKFRVFERLHNPLILGVDFLEANKCTICYDTMTLKSTNGEPIVPLRSIFTHAYNIGLARTVRDTIIPAGQTVIGHVKLSRVSNNTFALIEPVSRFNANFLSHLTLTLGFCAAWVWYERI